MAKDNKINMPSSGAGLTRYYEGQESNITFSPESVAVVVMLSAVAIIAIQWFLG